MSSIRLTTDDETDGRNITSSPRLKQSGTTHRAKIKQDITHNRKHARGLRRESCRFASQTLFFARTSHTRYGQQCLEKPGNQSMFTLALPPSLSRPPHRSTMPLNHGGGLLWQKEFKPASEAHLRPSASGHGNDLILLLMLATEGHSGSRRSNLKITISSNSNFQYPYQPITDTDARACANIMANCTLM